MVIYKNKTKEIRKKLMKLKNNKKFKILKKVTIVACCLIIIGIIFYVAITVHVNNLAKKYITTLDDAPESDAVIILGARVYSDGKPSPVLQDRLDYGYELYINKKVKKILVSGDHGTKGYDEVNAMKDYLLDKGVPREDIFLDHAGFNTYDSMYRAKDIYGIETMIISTQQFHINRSIYIARNIGICAYGYPSEDKSAYNMNYLNFRENLAKVKAYIDTDIVKRKPKYLGDIISIKGSGTLTDG